MAVVSGRRLEALLAVAALAVGAAACSPRERGSGDTSAPTSRVPTTEARSEPTRTPTTGGFALGVEYAERGLGARYGDTGVRWAKTRLEAFAWDTVEPEPPREGRHDYDWSCTDATVAEYQRAGITALQSYVSSASRWGGAPGRSPMPSEERLADFAAWVGALVERYDADGVGDAPGLLAPVRHWVIGGEWTGFWGNATADDYLLLLRTARDAARAADPEAQLGAIPFMLYDVFGGNPTPAEVEQRLGEPPPVFRKSTEGMMEILDATDLYDFVDLHSLGDVSELVPMLRWMREQLAARGADDTPIWVDDAIPASFLVNLGWPMFPPVQPDQVGQVWDLITRATDDSGGEEQGWIEAQAAIGLVRKAVTAAGEGAAGINVGNTEDWIADRNAAFRRVSALALGAGAFFGLADVSHPNGFGACAVRVPGGPRAGHTNLGLVAGFLEEGWESVEPVAAEPASLRGYRFERNGGVAWALWLDDGRLDLPGEAQERESVSVDAPPGVATVTVQQVAAERVEAPAPVSVRVVEGSFSLDLGPVPVFVTAR